MVKNRAYVPRLLKPTGKSSFFLFGPRGTGKTSWLHHQYPTSNYLDLLDDEIFLKLKARPRSLSEFLDKSKLDAPIIIDEIQKTPKLLDEVHRLIEQEGYQFILTGSNGRKLKKMGSNLLAGRALTYEMGPLTAMELGSAFDLMHSLQYGTLPMCLFHENPKKYLYSYVTTYLKEEIYLEGLTKNLDYFSRFLQIASFSQGAPLVISNIAAECSINRKVVEDYFGILHDLLLSVELPVFSKRAKRELMSKKKFYFFDAGIFQVLRPKGPLDSIHEVNGVALETLVLNELRQINHAFELEYEIFYWRTKDHREVDFVLYGPKGMIAIEVKLGGHLKAQDLQSLKLFKEDYPECRCFVVYGGDENKIEHGMHFISANEFFKNCYQLMAI